MAANKRIQLFTTMWKEGISNAFVPKSFGGSGMSLQNTHQVAHHMRKQSHQLKTVMEAHYSAQIALSSADKQKQATFYPLMVNHPVVAAAPSINKSNQTPKATYKVTGDRFQLNGKSIAYRNADIASLFLVEAKSADNPDQSTMFMLDKHELGICLEPKQSQVTKDENNRLVSFHNVTLKQDNVIGKEGEGHNLRNAMSVAMEEVLNNGTGSDVKAAC